VRTGYATGEVPFLHKDGDRRYWLVDGVQIAPDRFMGFVRDITERKRAQEALRRERDLLDLITDTSPSAITVIDLDGQISFANQRAEEILGLTKDQITQRSYNAPAWHITDYEGHPFPDEKLPFSQVIATEQPVYNVHHAIEWPDGHCILLDINAAPLFDEAGQLKGVVATANDVTKRKRAEAALRKSEEKFKSLYTSMTEGVCLHELVYNDDDEVVDYRITDVNPSYESILELKKEEVVHKLASDVYGIDPPPYVDIYAVVAQTDTPVQFETYYPPLDKHFLISAFSTGKDQFATTFEDITERKQAEAALRESEEKLRNIVENSTNLFYSHTTDHELTYLSPQSREFLQCEPEEAMRRWTEFVTDNPINEVGFAMTQKAIRTGERQPPYELELKDLEGRKIHVEVREAPVVKDGQTVAIVGSLTDITQRKQIESALREERDRAQRYLDIAGVMFVALDTQGRVTLINQRGSKTLGYRQEEILGKNWFDHFLPSRLKDEVKAVFHQLIGGQINPAEYYENPILTQEGEERMIAWHNTTLKDDGQITGILSSGEDITERVQAEAALRASEEKYRLLFDSADVLISVYNREGVCQLMNRKVAALFGGKPQEFIGKTFDDLHPEMAQEFTRRIRQTIDTGRSQRYEDRISFPQDTRWLLSLVQPVPDAQGNIHTAQIISQDITQRKRAEAQLKQALAERTALLQELYHRTKNNMQVICALLDFQAARLEDQAAREALTETQNRIQSMALVHKKLYQSQDLSRINLGGYIRDLASLLIQSYQLPSNKVTMAYNMEDVFVLIDTAVPCGLILNELISNALKYAFPGNRQGEIAIQLRRAEDEAIALQVADNGVGVPEDFDFRRDGALGLRNVFALGERQLQGQVHFERRDGVSCRLQFKDNLYTERV
jgi:PAS domain S-box-containing protein